MKMHDMPKQLENAWTRLYRAKENYSSLNDEVMKFMYEYFKGMIKGWNSEKRCFSVQLHHPNDSVMAGRSKALVVNIIEDLRAALDYMVFELSALNTPSLNEKTPQFVIADTKERFDKESKSRLSYLTDEQKTKFIENVQPFNGNSILGILRDLSRESKHRRLLSVRDNSGWEMFLAEDTKIEEYKDCFMYPMEKGHAIFVRPKSYDIVLLEKYHALTLLKALAEHVGDIVKLSHCFFEGRPFKMEVLMQTVSDKSKIQQ